MLPDQYTSIKKRFRAFFTAAENLGKAAKNAGPISGKNSHLIQLAAAAAIRSEGAVHSHTRRALELGAVEGRAGYTPEGLASLMHSLPELKTVKVCWVSLAPPSPTPPPQSRPASGGTR